MNRRSFLATAAGSALGLHASTDPAAAILQRILAPRFHSRLFDITKYGARDGGRTLNTRAITDAIRACASAGGGTVLVPPGRFLSGPVHLESNVNLHLSKGATLLFSTNPEEYLPLVFTRWEGIECMGYSPLLYAWGKTNIAITGEGVLDGQAGNRHWWPWKGKQNFGWTQGAPEQAAARKALEQAAERDTPVAERRFGSGSYLRPQFVQPYNCTNVLIEGVTVRNSPMWEIHPVLCRNVTVRNVKIDTHGPNNDGCDPECCTDVLIEGCLFDTGDDCIAIKSGRNRDGRRVAKPCENLIIRDCTMQDGHGGVTIGSEVSGNVRDVFVENCRMDSPRLERALRLKTNSYRGGTIERVRFRNVAIGQVSDSIVSIDFFYEEGQGGPFRPIVRDILVEHVTCRQSPRALYVRGYKDAPIRNVTLRDCDFASVLKQDVTENVEGLVQERVHRNS